MESLVEAHQTRLMSVMPQVKQYEAKLDALNAWWDKITLVGKINSYNLAATILDDMQNTKEKFGELHGKLIDNLLLEHLQKLVVDNTSKSQVAIDILIRNLFERTADVGFLATDQDIRIFLEQREKTQSHQAFMQQRLQEYVEKYSVYDEIILLDTNGLVCAHLDPANPITHCHDPLIAATLGSDDDYLETFGYSDLQPKRRQSLIYSCKITRTNDPHSELLGVLCLCFRFDDEVDGIVGGLLADSDSEIQLVDKEGCVIASSDPQFVAVGSSFQYQNRPRMLHYQGKHYLVNSTQTHGYQGFFGLGWWAQVLTPIEQAFKIEREADIELDNQDVINSTRLFSRVLKEIYTASNDVNEDLSLVVLNGKITAARQNAVEFVPVLEEIKQIGENTASIFSASIRNLQATVVSSKMNDLQFMATLAVDIMDRNLYERANDCRWWALTSDFRRILAKPVISDEDLTYMEQVLSYINELYTVYTNLYLFDKNQIIIAVSNPQQRHFIGQSVSDQSGAKQALSLQNSQQYSVSPFMASDLYAQQYTYIYNAAVSRLDADWEVIGGIGIVFDSQPQFEAMLNDALPKNEVGSVSVGSFALFVERHSQMIISASAQAPQRQGEYLALDDGLFELIPGGKHATIIDYMAKPYIVGMAASKGYREYKTTEDYQNDVLSFIFVPL
ncbi:hypothetical protein [Agarivorans sp. QJM3NY_33]|uniref:hypothetical protein n=1 Tax=Agarivorans sp. QJM3NY_33 TaxID=3421432 RepID=UPI003D7C7BF5